MKVFVPLAASEAATSEDDNPLKIEFTGRILLIGFGGVGRGILPALLKHTTVDPKNITVIEKDDSTEHFQSMYADTGIHYRVKELTRDTMGDDLAQLVGPGDLIVNLSLNIDGIEIVQWCLRHKVMYIDTSIERWPDVPDEKLDLAERTLYTTHRKIREMAKEHKEGSTCVVTHGANPGLVSHFVKAALIDMAKHLHIDTEEPQTQEQWARLMDDLGVKVIHIAERDTQVIDRPKVKNEFVNTWSCEGFWAEGRAPAEMGWGSHEPTLPRHAFEHEDGPRNAIYFEKPGVSLMAKSWVPKGGEINGFCIQHSEAITISEYFTLYREDKVVFRPTVHYVYCPCDAALVSVHEFKGRELEMQDSRRIAREEIVAGIDELGVFLMGEQVNWWYGSQLGIKQTRNLLPDNNATTLQVVASMLGALAWMVRHPNEGYCEPEDLPYREVLEVALPYLGPMVSQSTEWMPTQHLNKLFNRPINNDNPFAFANFRVY